MRNEINQRLGRVLVTALLVGISACSLPLRKSMYGAHAVQSESTPQSVAKKDTEPYDHTGLASFYGKGDGFSGQTTASGEAFDPQQLTAAHRTLPFGTKLKVTNLENGKQAVVTVNDRGPALESRIIDLSYAAAKQLAFIDLGVARVKLEQVPEKSGVNASSNND